MLRDEEQNGVRPAQKKTEQAEKPAEVQGEQPDLDDGVRGLTAHEEPGAIHLQHERFEQRQRKETEMLVFDGKPRKAVLRGGLVFGKCEQRYFDVGIARNVVRRAVMGIMLVEPPAVAEPEEEIGMDEAKCLIAGRPSANFLMACVVNDEAQLSENERQEGGVADFYPRIGLKFRNQQEGENEKREVEEHFTDVIRGLLRQQPALAHQSQ